MFLLFVVLFIESTDTEIKQKQNMDSVFMFWNSFTAILSCSLNYRDTDYCVFSENEEEERGNKN